MTRVERTQLPPDLKPFVEHDQWLKRRLTRRQTMALKIIDESLTPEEKRNSALYSRAIQHVLGNVANIVAMYHGTFVADILGSNLSEEKKEIAINALRAFFHYNFTPQLISEAALRRARQAGASVFLSGE